MRGLLIPLLILLALILALCLRVSSSTTGGSVPSSDNPILPLTPKHETAILVAPNGKVYLVDIGSGNVLWSFSSGDSIYSSFQQIPSNEGEKLNTSVDGDNFYIDCGEDWELYLHANGLKKVKLPLKAEELVGRSPFVSAGGGVLLGSKKTAVFLVDAVTGDVIRTIRSDKLHVSDESSNLTATEIEEWKPITPISKDDIEKHLYVTRTDYALSYTSVKTGEVLWYLMFADVEASFRCDGIENIFGSFPDKFRSKNLPVHCHTRPVVYRIRDRSSLESLFIGNRRLQDTFLGNIVPPLPASDNQEMEYQDKSLALLHDKYDVPVPMEFMIRALALRYNDKGENMLALPSSERKEMIDEINGTPGISFPVEDLQFKPDFWHSPIVFVACVVFGCLFSVFSKFIKGLARRWFITGNGEQQLKQTKDIKAQNLAPRKRKSRRLVSKQDMITSTKQEENSKHTVTSNPEVSRDRGSDEYVPAEGRRIGKMIVTDKEIAKGSNGTIVLEGTYEGRLVAVKRLVKTHHSVAAKEIQNLIASDQHPNIVRWYGVEYDQDFVYLCLELCSCNLYDLISSCASANRTTGTNHELEIWKSNGYPSPSLLKLTGDIVRGLAHMHELGIVHRDLKPQNVLVIKDRSVTAKISDMGISKHLDGEMTSLTSHTTGNGTSGWQAPEQLRREKQTRAVDLFSLGCVLFFCITGGFHPFGESIERDVNILNDKKDLFLIDHIPEAVDLISFLLQPKPDLRPKAREVAKHPMFWNSEMRLSFLRDASDRVELEDEGCSLLEELENRGKATLGGKWDEKMDAAFMNDIGRYRRYKYDSVRDLLRVIRNKLNHYRELSKEVQVNLGSVPDGFDSYFTLRFPKLLIDVYHVVAKYCADEETFVKYFTSI